MTFPSSENKKNILVPCQMGIGNLIMFEPFLKKLRISNKNSYIVAVFSLENNTYNFFCKFFSKYVDKIIQLNLNNKNFILKILSGYTLKKIKWDSIYLRFNVPYEIYYLLFFKKVKTVVGFKFINQKKWFYKFITHEIFYEMDLHESYNYCKLANFDKGSNYEYPKIISKNIECKELKKEIIISPGVSKKMQYKSWPLNYWVELINFLINKDYNISLVGSLEDKVICNLIFNSVDKKNKLKNLCNDLDIIDLHFYVKKAYFIISSDSMIYHLANSLQKRNLVILSVTDDKRILYNNDYSNSIRSPSCKGSCITHFHDDRNNDCNPEICMKNLTSDLVIKKLGDILKIDEKN